MRIRKLEEIDQEKLRVLFEKRGHGITDPSFWSKIELILQTPLMEVHQCKCGEVGWMPFIISQLNTENGDWVCKKCGKYEEEVVPYSIAKEIDNLLELSREFIVDTVSIRL